MVTLIWVSVYTVIALIVEDWIKWGLSECFGYNDMSLIVVIMSMCWIVLLPTVAITCMFNDKLRNEIKKLFKDSSN